MTDQEQRVDLERNGATAILTLYNRGRRNAFTPEMRRDLTARLRELAKDGEVRAVIVTGGDGHFCTGADLARVAARARPATAMETRENMKEVLDLFRVITLGAKPVIAAVEGDAYGAGCSIALACDVVVAARSSRFGMTFSRIGIVPDMGMLYSLVERVGKTRARRMMMLGEVVAGPDATLIGMADELAEDGEALAKARDIARSFETPAPIPIALIKAAMGAGLTSVEDVIRAELDLVPIGTSSEDCREGIAAFRAKRPPVFQGR